MHSAKTYRPVSSWLKPGSTTEALPPPPEIHRYDSTSSPSRPAHALTSVTIFLLLELPATAVISSYSPGRTPRATTCRCDNDSFLNSNRVPIDKMIAYLEQYFSPDTPGDHPYSLAISAGEGGARLTHSHARQYNFALQVKPVFWGCS